jgi:hypothetical protein
MLHKKCWESILSLLCPSVLLSIRWSSSYLLNLLSEINVVYSKCSLRHRLVNQDLSRSFWKVQGHSEHIKIQLQHFFIYEVHISSEIDDNQTCKLLGHRSLKVILRGQGHSVHVPHLRKFLFQEVFDHILSC